MPTSSRPERPTVGIATPCYNSQNFIEQCMASVDAQTYPHWVHVLVDDGSTDRTPSLIAAASEREDRRRILQQPNAGPGAARNRGIRHLPPDTEYVLCLDSDDYLTPEALETLVRHMESHPTVGLLKWESILVDEHGNEATLSNWWGDGARYEPSTFWMRRVPDDEPHIGICSIFTGLHIYPSCTIFRRSVLDQTSGFPEGEDFRQGAEDMHLFVELALKGSTLMIPDRLSFHRIHDQQLTSERQDMGDQGRHLLHAWHRKRVELSSPQRRQVEEALSFAELRYPLSARLASARRLMMDGSFADGLRVLGGALCRYGLSLLPHRFQYRTLARWAGWSSN